MEDLHEALAGAHAELRFGLAFCEASGDRLVRRSGNAGDLVEVAEDNALRIGAGHSFVVVLRGGFAVNVLDRVKAVPEVCTVFCATANPVDVLVAVTDRGRGIVGVGRVPTPRRRERRRCGRAAPPPARPRLQAVTADQGA